MNRNKELPKSVQNALARALRNIRNSSQPEGLTRFRAFVNMTKIYKAYKELKEQEKTLNLMQNFYYHPNKPGTKEHKVWEKITHNLYKLRERERLLSQMFNKLIPITKHFPANVGKFRLNFMPRGTKTEKALRLNAAVRHIEQAMTSPHTQIGRKLLMKKISTQIENNRHSQGMKRPRNNNNKPRPKNNSESDENYRRYILNWLRGRNVQVNNNANLNHLLRTINKGKYPARKK